MHRPCAKHLILLLSVPVLLTCSTPFTVSVNDQAVYDPDGRLAREVVTNADLQGCINLALRQQSLTNPAAITVLSCTNSQIDDLENIDQLQSLRFLDLANNNITNITPLESLPALGGLNLVNNRIIDIGPLLNIPSLVSVSLLGNNNIPCAQLQQLRLKIGANLTPPDRCSE